MERAVLTRPKPKRQKSYASLASDGGKPCPTCYAQMTLTARTEPAGRKGNMAVGEYWACTTHGAPSKP